MAKFAVGFEKHNPRSTDGRNELLSRFTRQLDMASVRLSRSWKNGINFGNRTINLKAMAAEFVGMTFFVFFATGSAIANPGGDAKFLLVALTFGTAIMVLAYTIAHHSGGQLNCAVTFSLMLGGKVTIIQALANMAAQVAGSMLGSLLLMGIFSCEQDQTQNLASNIVNEGFSTKQAILAEVMGTALLCYVVWETAVSSESTVGNNAAIAIGFAVFIAHIVLIPIDGCSINPTRSFGPALMSYLRDCDNQIIGSWGDMWIMTVGPMTGGALAAMLQWPFLQVANNEEDKEMVDDASKIVEEGRMVIQTLSNDVQAVRVLER
mmetsp:Transcript_66744/g.114671  ORF Transcript_66744/g.114671 Transcript_66744/m.114671 type:complete len:321 (-) Transcript_66744:23-985(-)